MNYKVTILLFNKNNISLVKKNKKLIFYIYNKNFFFSLILKNNIIYFFDKYSRCVTITFLKNNIFKNLLINNINKLLFSWNNFFFKKIKFSGKGYKIKKSIKKKNIKFYFNRSHPVIYFFKKKIFKKIRKSKFLIKMVNIVKLSYSIEKILKIRHINLYTQKGLKLSRKINLKKASKKGVSL